MTFNGYICNMAEVATVEVTVVNVTVVDYVQRGRHNTQWLVKDKDNAMWTVLVVNGGETKAGSVLTVDAKALAPADEALLKRLANRRVKVQASS